MRLALEIINRQRLWGLLLKGFLLGVFKLGTYWTCYIWLPKFLQNEFHQDVGPYGHLDSHGPIGQFLGMMAFGVVADRLDGGLRSLRTRCSPRRRCIPLAFHWRELLEHPAWFWAVLFALGLGSGCTAGFGCMLAELFPTQVRNFAMGTTYNCARGIQFLAPIVVDYFVSKYGIAGGLGVPLVLALATAAWVWTLPETRARDLSLIAAEAD